MKKIDVARRKKILKTLTVFKGIGALLILSLFGQSLLESSKKEVIVKKVPGGTAYWS